MFQHHSAFRVLTLNGFMLILFCALSGCQTKPQLDETLYQELGGKTAIRNTVHELVSQLHSDPKLSELFIDVDRAELTQNIEDFLCKVSDGGCEYQGASMIDSHTELNITKAEFDYFVTLFIRSMTHARIDFPAQNKLLSRLAKLRPEIIEL